MSVESSTACKEEEGYYDLRRHLYFDQIPYRHAKHFFSCNTFCFTLFFKDFNHAIEHIKVLIQSTF